MNIGVIANQRVPESIPSGININVGFSFRKIVPGYSGSAIKIHNGVSESAFGFNGDYTDDVAISTFVNAGTQAKCTEWFDQKGGASYVNSNPALAPDVIVNNGVIELFFDDTFFLSRTPSNVGDMTSVVMKTTDQAFIVFTHSGAGHNFRFCASTSSTDNSTSFPTQGTMHDGLNPFTNDRGTFRAKSTGNYKIINNRGIAPMLDNINTYSSSFYDFNGYIKEIITSTGNEVANVTNQKNYYNL